MCLGKSSSLLWGALNIVNASTGNIASMITANASSPLSSSGTRCLAKCSGTSSSASTVICTLTTAHAGGPCQLCSQHVSLRSSAAQLQLYRRQLLQLIILGSNGSLQLLLPGAQLLELRLLLCQARQSIVQCHLQDRQA